MKNLQPPSKVHILVVSAGALLVGIFLWSTLNTFAFVGPTANPPTGNGAVNSDSSNNVYIGGNLNVTGTITSAGGLGGSAISAGNVSAGEFGSNTGGGNFSFPGNVGIGTTTSGIWTALNVAGMGLFTGGGVNPGDGTAAGVEVGYNGGGFIQAVQTSVAWENLSLQPGGGNVGIGTTNPTALLTLAGGTTSVSPLRFTSGTNLTTATSGAMEFDGTRFYLTPAGTRYGVPMSTSITNTLLFANAGAYTVTFPGTGTAGLIGTSQTWSGVNTNSGQVAITKAGAASTPALYMTGALYAAGTGTTNFPYIYYNKGATAPTTFATGGTVLGFNAASGFAGNFEDYRVNGGSSVFTVNSSGNVYTAGNVGIGTTTPAADLQVTDVNGSSTLRIGQASKTACLEMTAASGTVGNLVYIYYDSNAVQYATTTKPSFCQ